MRALVVGGAGFIGSSLVERLLAESWHVEVVDDLSTGSLDRLAAARADAAHTPLERAGAMAAAFEAEGFRVKRDSPFAGSFVPGGFYGRERRVRSVMIEVRRGLYMDESTTVRRHDFEDVRAALERATASGLAAAVAE